MRCTKFCCLCFTHNFSLKTIMIITVILFSLSTILDVTTFGIMFNYNLPGQVFTLISLAIWIKIVTSIGEIFVTSIGINKDDAFLAVWLEYTFVNAMVQVICLTVILASGNGDFDAEIEESGHIFALMAFFFIFVIEWTFLLINAKHVVNIFKDSLQSNHKNLKELEPEVKQQPENHQIITEVVRNKMEPDEKPKKPHQKVSKRVSFLDENNDPDVNVEKLVGDSKTVIYKVHETADDKVHDDLNDVKIEQLAVGESKTDINRVHETDDKVPSPLRRRSGTSSPRRGIQISSGKNHFHHVLIKQTTADANYIFDDVDEAFELLAIEPPED